jgi:hypothetical protein
MDNFSVDDNARNLDWKQTSERVASRYGQPNSVDVMDHYYEYLGSHSPEFGPMDPVFPQPLEVAFGAEVGHTMASANDRQVDGSHYQDIGAVGSCAQCGAEVQHWDWAGRLPGLEYAATKYLARWRIKGGLASLEKALHYVQKIIEQNFPGVRVSISVDKVPPSAPTVGGVD